MNDLELPQQQTVAADTRAAARMAALKRYNILDTERDAVFDGIAELAATLLDAPIAVVNFIADDRQWFKAEIGIGQRELPLDVSICRVALPERGIFVVPDLTRDERFSGNPLVTVAEGLRFYAGAVLEAEGVPIGTVCVLDNSPRIDGISDAQRRGLEALSVQAMAALERSAAAARDRFKLSLSEALLEHDDADDMMSVAARMIGEHLGISQVGFGMVDSAGDHATVGQAWTDGRMPSISGRWRLDDFGQDRVALLKAGRTLAIDDIHMEDRGKRAVAEAPYALAIRSVLTVPLVRDGALVAVLFVHHPDARVWRDDEVALVQDCAARLWNAVLRARADARFRAQANELESIFAAAPVGLCVLDLELRYVRMNERLAEFSGVSAAEYIGKTPEETLPQFEGQGAPILQRVLAGEAVMGAEYVGEMPGRPGAIRAWRANLVPLRNGDDEIIGITVAADEITDEKDAADKLVRALELTEIAQAAAHAVLYEFDPVNGMTKPSQNFERITGYSSDTKVSLEWWQSLVHPADLSVFIETLEATLKHGNDYFLEYRLLHNDGHWIWVSDRGRALSIGDGLHRLVGMFVDITEQRQAQQALIESEGRYRAVFEQVGIGVARTSLDGRFIQVNDRYCTIVGRKREELVGESWQEIIHPDDLAADITIRERLMAGDGASFAIEKRYVGEDNCEIWVNLTLSVVRDAADVPTFFVAMIEDIGARKHAEAALSDSESTMRTLIDAAPVGLVFADATGQITHGNARLVEIIGHPIIQTPDIDAYGEYVSHHADGRRVEAREYPFARIFTGEAERAELEVLYRRGDGRDVWVRTVAAALRSADGTLLGAVGAMLDIDRETRLTQQLVSEVEHAVAERQTALAQLFEAQKLETIGQLTGGVAHDFNNLLTPIMGVLEMMQHRVAGEDRASRLVSGALQSAERAKNLVQRLLAFARRQNLETQAVELARLVEGMGDLIDRSIGPTIAVEMALDATLGAVRADANQLELALLNLAVNARDAMPGGGTLRLASRPEEVRIGDALQLGPGRYICLTVSDTGTGMDAETLRRCIEPFYTSKGIGDGTGLGLSMVHGMMRQLGGALNIISAPGQGTTMELWLPCSSEKAEEVSINRAPVMPALRRSTILLVDDEDLVRESTADMLDRLGYDVVQAHDGARALELLAAPNAIDALVSDYLMPGMTGRELAELARRDRPDLPVLLITGYTRLDEIGPELARLEKPFRQAEFAARMAELVGTR